MLKTLPLLQNKIRKCSTLSILTLTLLVVMSFVLFFGVLNVYSAEISLAWDQNSEPDIAGYKIYYGLASGSYTTVTDVGNFTSCTLTGLDDGETYYFAATAYNTSGYESGYSNEVSHSFSGGNEPPVANAGSDQTVAEGVTVTLNGSNSTDPDGSIVSYSWAQTSGPAVTLSDPTYVEPTFVTVPVDIAGTTMNFELTVRDNGGLETTDTVSVTINDNGITDFPETVLSTTSPQGMPIGLEEESGGNYVSVNTVESSTIPDDSSKPRDLIYDLIDMTIKVNTPGSMAKVAFYFSSPAPYGYKMYHYNRVSRRWTDYSNYAVFNPTRTKVTLTMIDGGVGDDDGVSNGIIIDPFALGSAPLYSNPPDSTGGSSSDGGSGSCFITTTTYGTSMKPMVLKDLNDYYLLLFPIAGLLMLVLMNCENVRRKKRVY